MIIVICHLRSESLTYKMQQAAEIAGISGLSPQEVSDARKLYGWNRLEIKTPGPIVIALRNAIKEPMLIFLTTASSIYFLTGAYAEGAFMVAAIFLISFISFYQEFRSNKALEALKTYSQPKARIIRNSIVQALPTEEIVVGDFFIIEEGEIVPADAVIVRSNDCSINESILTGESLPVSKSSTTSNIVFQGTMLVSGMAICQTTHIGVKTQIGKIGKSIQEITDETSPLQIQISDFVKKMATAGVLVFVIIWAVNFFKTNIFLESLMKALTLAMSILPEEIPVAFATFMALGAWRLVQLGIIVKQTRTVETLGSATVICVDKTGTITKNEMTLAAVYDLSTDTIHEGQDFKKAKDIITIAMWASEPMPFDPMEKALHDAYENSTELDERLSTKMIHEYPLAGVPPLMTHVFQKQNGEKIIACKGAPEALLRLSDLDHQKKQLIINTFNILAAKGYRVLAVADTSHQESTFPTSQEDFKFNFKGLVAFYDPPKDNITTVLESFYKAGIQVKLITGDNAITTHTIANQINFRNSERTITGEELMSLSKSELLTCVGEVNIFTRMFPDAKLKVIEALKERGHIVAMTGDGVNDGPALKAAHIGIAMGSKGSEVAKQASALILSNDDLSGMVDAVAMGRKIYNNLKKAIQYIISIHIPIILIVSIPIVLGWLYPAVFSPIHVIFLELIMGPTCSIIYENEPIEQNLMNEKPRVFSKTFFNIKELLTSIIQGLMITSGLISIYWLAVLNHETLPKTTSMIFVTLITANVLLTLVNRSFYFSLITTWKYKNNLIPLIIIITMLMLVTIFLVPVIRTFFGFEILTLRDWMICVFVGAISVLWFEVYKWMRRKSIWF